MFVRPVSSLTLGTEGHAGAVALLALAEFFRLITAGHGALIQGMRRIHDLTAMGVLGAFLGPIAGISLGYLFREQGVVPSLVVGAAVGIIVSWWYARRVKSLPPAMSRAELAPLTL